MNYRGKKYCLPQTSEKWRFVLPEENRTLATEKDSVDSIGV